VHVVTLDSVEMEEECVQLGTNDRAALLIPAEGRTIVAQVASEGGHVVGGVGEFEDTGDNPLPYSRFRVLTEFPIEVLRAWSRKLIQVAVSEMGASHLLACDVIKGKR